MVNVSKLVEAGAKKVGGFGEETSAKVFGKTAPDDTISKTTGGDLLVKSMPEEEATTLNQMIKGYGYQGPDIDFGLDMGRLGEIFEGDDQPQLLGNLMRRIQNENKELFNYMRRDKQSLDSLLKLSEQARVDKIMYKFLGMKPGQMAPPEDVVGGIVAIIRLTGELQYGVNKALQATGPEKQELFKKIARLGAIQANLSAKVSGVVSEYGRGLAVVRNISKLEGMNLTNYSEQLTNFMNKFDERNIDFKTLSEDDMNLRLEQFLRLPNPSKVEYAEKGFAAKTYDIAMEIYVNALLTSPVTHSVNIAGNGAFQLQKLAERGFAGFIGEFRSKMIGGANAELVTDRVFMGEAVAEAHAMIMAQKDAFTLMGRTFITGESGDFSSKIDLKHLRSIGKEDNIGKIMENAGKGDFTGMGYDILGVATRMSGRFLATEDEYFKVLSKRRVQYREAYKRASIDYRDALKSGMNQEKAKQVFSDTYADIMREPPSDVEELMTLEAKEMTFQSDLEGLASQLGGVANHPLMKPVMVFYKTPANIVQAVWDRSFNVFPVARAIKKGIGPKGSGGRDFDEAMSKLVMGWTVMTSMYALASGSYGDDIIVTGHGPSDRKARKLMSDKGIQPYSIGFRNNDGSYTTHTFSRMDPMSGLLAMAADMAYYMRDADTHSDPKMLDAMFRAATLSAAQYATNMPFLQGFAELMTAVGNPYGEKEDIIERLELFAGKKVGDIGMAVSGSVRGRMSGGLVGYFADQLDVPLIGATSFSRAMERYLDPTASNTMMPDTYIFGTHATELHPLLKGFYKSVQTAKSGHPSFSDDLPPSLDFWGNERKTSRGVFEEWFNPIRSTHDVKLNRLDRELLRLSEADAGTFSMHPKKIQGIELTGAEHNQFITLINQFDEEGRLPGDRQYDENTNLLNILNNYLDSTTNEGAMYYGLSRQKEDNAADDEDRYNFLSGEVTERRGYAKKMMGEMYPRLYRKLEEIE